MKRLNCVPACLYF